MGQKLIKNGYMGNCKDCYYSSFAYENNEFEVYICHRFPKPVEVNSIHYCGEFGKIVNTSY